MHRSFLKLSSSRGLFILRFALFRYDRCIVELRDGIYG